MVLLLLEVHQRLVSRGRVGCSELRVGCRFQLAAACMLGLWINQPIIEEMPTSREVGLLVCLFEHGLVRDRGTLELAGVSRVHKDALFDAMRCDINGVSGAEVVVVVLMLNDRLNFVVNG